MCGPLAIGSPNPHESVETLSGSPERMRGFPTLDGRPEPSRKPRAFNWVPGSYVGNSRCSVDPHRHAKSPADVGAGYLIERFAPCLEFVPLEHDPRGRRDA